MSHCPACNASALRESVKQKQFVTDGRSIEFAFVFSKCGECGAEVVSEAQSVENKRRKRLAEKHSGGIMSGEQIAGLRAKYRLTQSQAALIFGGGPVAFSKYEGESVLPSEAMSTLLEVAFHFPMVMEYLANRKGIVLPGEPSIPLVSISERFAAHLDKAEAQTAMDQKRFLLRNFSPNHHYLRRSVLNLACLGPQTTSCAKKQHETKSVTT